jgi:hypothetical protein
MADILTVTPTPIQVTGATKMNMWDAIDVGAYDILDLQLLLVASTGSYTSGSFTCQLLTSMQRQVDDGSWTATTFTSGNWTISSWPGSFPSGYPAVQDKGFLRYLRWNVTSLPTGITSVTFFIRGMARKYA